MPQDSISSHTAYVFPGLPLSPLFPTFSDLRLESNVQKAKEIAACAFDKLCQVETILNRLEPEVLKLSPLVRKKIVLNNKKIGHFNPIRVKKILVKRVMAMPPSPVKTPTIIENPLLYLSPPALEPPSDSLSPIDAIIDETEKSYPLNPHNLATREKMFRFLLGCASEALTTDSLTAPNETYITDYFEKEIDTVKKQIRALSKLIGLYEPESIDSPSSPAKQQLLKKLHEKEQGLKREKAICEVGKAHAGALFHLMEINQNITYALENLRKETPKKAFNKLIAQVRNNLDRFLLEKNKLYNLLISYEALSEAPSDVSEPSFFDMYPKEGSDEEAANELQRILSPTLKELYYTFQYLISPRTIVALFVRLKDPFILHHIISMKEGPLKDRFRYYYVYALVEIGKWMAARVFANSIKSTYLRQVSLEWVEKNEPLIHTHDRADQQGNDPILELIDRKELDKAEAAIVELTMDSAKEEKNRALVRLTLAYLKEGLFRNAIFAYLGITDEAIQAKLYPIIEKKIEENPFLPEALKANEHLKHPLYLITRAAVFHGVLFE